VSWKQVLVCSKESDFLNFIQQLVGDLKYSLRLVRGAEEFQGLDTSYEPSIMIIDCLPNTEMKMKELVQSAWKKYPKLRVALVYRTDFSLGALEKIYTNPQAICLQNPFEMDDLLNWMLQMAPVEIPTSQLKFEHLSSVQVSDLGAEENLGFDLYYYMPSNKKFLHFRRKDSEVSVEQMERFKKANIRDLYLLLSELPQLHSYLAARLKKAAQSSNGSPLQKRKNIKAEAKEVIRIILGSKRTGVKESRMALESCKQVAMQFIQETTQRPELLEKLKELAALGKGSYNHAINVSIYCTLFAMVLEEKNLEAASVAGLLHDIGFATMEKQVDESKPNELNEKDLTFLKAHPEAGTRILLTKNLLKDPEIHAVIAGHHEHMDGSGYPNGLKQNQISSLARICAIADEFDHLTSLTFGAKPMEPLAAIDFMIERNHLPDKPHRFDDKMLSAIRMAIASPGLTLVHGEKKDEAPVREVAPEPVAAEIAAKAPVADDSKRRRRVKSGMKY
jgi:HD-GYP domain-containing protein (c-di-GMP phosphodiesterase class II)